MEKEKKAWILPELTVLVRNKPDEAVLGACKGVAYTGPTGDDCYYHYLCTNDNPS